MKSKKDAESQIGKMVEPKISEDFLQKMVAKYIDTKYPKSKWCHVPNGGSRHVLEAVKLKAMGVKPGVPDVMIFERKLDYIGLAVELKVGKNKTSENQDDWLEKLGLIGWKTAVCYTFEDAKAYIDNYLA